MAVGERVSTRPENPADRSLRLHGRYRGKVQVMPRCPVRGLEDFSIWYTPGVAAPCRAIAGEPELVFEHTNKGNSVAIVTDGSRVLGLGDIGPEAGLPVMEGKALLFKLLGGVDAVPVCLSTRDPDEIVRAVELIAPTFGGVNLEDIAQPKCFRVLDQLRDSLAVPVWHDDQQGTATVLLAGLVNALKVVGKDLAGLRVAMIGMGAANVAVYRLLTAYGLDPAGIVACDSRGTLHPGRNDIERQQDRFPDKWRVCSESNAERVVGGVAEALRGADACIAFCQPQPGLIQPEWIGSMAADAIVFACANPEPEIWPAQAEAAGARIVATGRGDFRNQLNNSLAFPGIFRGVLDVRARSVSGEMTIAAALEIARFAEERGLSEARILPTMDDWRLYPRVAVATGMTAQEQGLARLPATREALLEQATLTIGKAREGLQALMREGVIAPLAE